MTLRVIAFTGGPNVPSARYRVRQYVQPLLSFGIELTEVPSRAGRYPPAVKTRRPGWLVKAVAQGLSAVLSNRSADVTLLQRELVSTMPTFEWLAKRPRVLDVDDAIFLQRRGIAARKLAHWVDLVICGNSYLANWFESQNANIAIVPTAVDTDRFFPAARQEPSSKVVLGWVGTSGNLHELTAIEPALVAAMHSRATACLRVVCDRRPTFRELPSERVEWEQWSPDREVTALQQFDVGLMPLRDTAWARGKCSFKMLQYMACGVPVVVSPVGMNREVLGHGDLGLSATSQEEWTSALIDLIDSDTRRETMGVIGRRVVEARYSVGVIAPQMADILKRVAC